MKASEKSSSMMDIHHDGTRAHPQNSDSLTAPRQGENLLPMKIQELIAQNRRFKMLYNLCHVLDEMKKKQARISPALPTLFCQAIDRPFPRCALISMGDASESTGDENMVADAVFSVEFAGRKYGEVHIGRPASAPELQLTHYELSLLGEMANRLSSHVGAVEAIKMAGERQTQLMKADKLASLGVMTAGVAHAVNNPVNNIMLNTSLLRDAIDDITLILNEHFSRTPNATLGGLPCEEMVSLLPKMLDDMLQSCERIKLITSDLKCSSPGDYEKTHESIRVNDAVERSVRLCGHMNKQFKDRVDLTLADTLPEVACGSQRLEQVLIHLLQNAWQALQRPDARIAIKTAIHDETGNILITIRDEGCGMPPAVLDRITDPFFSTRRDEGGAGLGIYIANCIIDEMGGHLLFESREDNGTLVSIRLPSEGRVR